MDIYDEIHLQDCPYCGGAALLEEEGSMSWYVICVDCGSRTASFNFSSDAERLDTARGAAHLWNMGKILRETTGD